MCAMPLSSAAFSQSSMPTTRPAIVPQPARMDVAPGQFVVDSSTTILVDFNVPDIRAVGEILGGYLRDATGHTVPVKETDEPVVKSATILLTTSGASATLGKEGYELTITPQSVQLRARTAAGLFYGVQTIRQLLPPTAQQQTGRSASVSIPCVQITDSPRFAWRGTLLDCGRHFMTKDFVKRYIDLLAYHKMNVLHWHLTEDQGWRIEIKKYPKLTEVGAWRVATRDDEQPRDPAGRYGGFYTQDDVREVVAYAKSRFVTVVPEIEMPGHSLAALAAYPELSCTGGPFKVGEKWGISEDVYCAGNEKTFEFLEGVLTEVLELFPSEFIHIGGDECPKARWEKCPKCQARIKAEGLADPNELQSYFIRRMEKLLNAKGRRLIGWDEILEGGLAPNATVEAWRGMDAAVAAAQADHDVIASPRTYCYLDYPQQPDPTMPRWMALTTLEKVYSFDPMPPELTPAQAHHILGAEANVWTENIAQERFDYMAFPRLCAFAEVTWSPAAARNWDDFSQRMKMHYQRLDALGVKYCRDTPGK